MNSTLWHVSAGVIALVALLILPVAANAATASGPSNETTVAAVIHVGDKAIVRTDGAALMVGREVLAKLPTGQQLPITAIQGSWLGTSLEVNGKTLSGWVPATDVMLAQASNTNEAKSTAPCAGKPTTSAGPQRVTAFRPITPEPELPPVERNCVLRGQRSYGPGEWDYYFNGHFEPDPDIHSWEP